MDSQRGSEGTGKTTMNRRRFRRSVHGRSSRNRITCRISSRIRSGLSAVLRSLDCAVEHTAFFN